MYIALIADEYPPKSTSAAIQVRDLAEALVLLGCKPIVMVPSPIKQKKAWSLEFRNGVQILRLRAPETKGIGFSRRALNESVMPFFMIYGFLRSPLLSFKFNGLIWYSPSIFLSIFTGFLKRIFFCKSYLILRDIFPKWAVDLGLLRQNSMAYFFLKIVEAYQFRIADKIGIQSSGNLAFLDIDEKNSNLKVEVLHNWLADTPVVTSTIRLEDTILRGRYIFIYAGNMGVAQGMNVLLDLASSLEQRKDIGFLFVGRGSCFNEIREFISTRDLTNALIFEEVDPSEIPALYAQCHVGIISLDPRHETHNIPGKFISYMKSGLPVLAAINKGNDLEDLIKSHSVGKVSTSGSVNELRVYAESLVAELKQDPLIGEKCRVLAKLLFSPEAAARQVVRTLNS